MKKKFRIYGKNGHRNAASFGTSETWHFDANEKIPERTIEIMREDKTGTNSFVEVAIEMEDENAIRRELRGQIEDGIFENVRIGDVFEIVDGEEIAYNLYADLH